MQRVLFIDRDGVVNRMVRYDGGFDSPQKVEDVLLVDGIGKVISWANRNFIPVVLISNQPGVAKGKMTKETFGNIEKKIDEDLLTQDAHIDKKYFCFHHLKSIVPELLVDCDCRKPKPGLLLKAASEMDIDLENSLFLGDKGSDAEAGTAAGCKTMIYLHSEDTPEKKLSTENAASTYKINDISEAMGILEVFFQK